MNKKLLLIALITVAFVSTGCSISFNGQKSSGNDGGVYISPNKGEIFRQMVMMPSLSGRAENIGYLNVKGLSMDPNDAAAIYLASYDYGLFYTYNVTKGWNHVEALGDTTINDVVVAPDAKCTIYVAISNKLLRSTDCSRTWNQLYYGPNTDYQVTSIAVDHYLTDRIYVGNAGGDLMVSSDYGNSWRTINRFTKGVQQIFINPKDSRDVLVATADNQLYRSSADGNHWTNLREELSDVDLGKSFVNLLFSENDDTLLWVTDTMILRSPDNGLSWVPLKLLTPPAESHIRAVAFNPFSNQEIYYATDKVFVSSLDGGLTWTSKNLPSQRSASDILIDRENTDLIYLSVARQQ